jgi:hypothetical protein
LISSTKRHSSRRIDVVDRQISVCSGIVSITQDEVTTGTDEQIRTDAKRIDVIVAKGPTFQIDRRVAAVVQLEPFSAPILRLGRIDHNLINNNGAKRGLHAKAKGEKGSLHHDANVMCSVWFAMNVSNMAPVQRSESAGGVDDLENISQTKISPKIKT